MDFISCLSAGLPSKCLACSCLDSLRSIASFTVAGWTSWHERDIPSAIALIRTRRTPRGLHVTLDALFREPFTRSDDASLLCR